MLELSTTGIPHNTLHIVKPLVNPSKGNPKIVHLSVILCCLERVCTEGIQQQCNEKVENLKGIETIIIKLKFRRVAFRNLNSNCEEHRYYKSSVLLSKQKQSNNEMTMTDHIMVEEINFSLRKSDVPMSFSHKMLFEVVAKTDLCMPNTVFGQNNFSNVIVVIKAMIMACWFNNISSFFRLQLNQASTELLPIYYMRSGATSKILYEIRFRPGYSIKYATLSQK